MAPDSERKYWYLSLVLSLTAVAVIGWVWVEAYNEEIPKHNVVRSVNQGRLVEFHNSNLPSKIADAFGCVPVSLEETTQLDYAENPLIKIAIPPDHYMIPTGVFIQSIHFLDSNDVSINGYVWQKYPKRYLEEFPFGCKDDFPSSCRNDYGVIFPEEVDSGSTEKRLAYVRAFNDYLVIGWYFDVVVRQSFEYSDYPLDSQSVWLRMWPRSIRNKDRIVLIPDLASYSDKERCPGRENEGILGCSGLDQGIVKGAWELDGTYFNYKLYKYDTSLGLRHGEGQRYLCPELRFNVAAKREFRDAFVINLVPLLIVALLLFSQVMMVTGKEKESTAFGFNAAGVIATCAALFFVVMLAHIQLRSQFAGSGVMYIEYFYFIMYFFILLAALNAYVFSLGRLKRLNIIFFNDNFIPKVSFWPVLLWSMAIATVAEFWHALD